MPFMLSICTSDATVLSTTSNHLAWLGRSRDGVIGHRCSEWASPEHWDLNWHLFQRSLSTGMPIAWDRMVIRADGSRVHGHVMVRPIRTRKRGVLMMCANSILTEPDARDLTIDVAACFADMAHVAPVACLKPQFEELVAYAAESASGAYGLWH